MTADLHREAVNEPDNHTVLEDRDGDLWVRFDEWPGGWPAAPAGSWRHITGPGWDEWARNKVGKGHAWSRLQDYRPLAEVDAERAAWALALVEEAYRND